MELGDFSVSLAVKDIASSKAFYEKLGFRQLEGLGGVDEKWLILQNGSATIGLFQDMFDENILTFNPVRARPHYETLKADPAINFLMESDSVQNETTGPCHFCITDPDGNQILFDQHTDQ